MANHLPALSVTLSPINIDNFFMNKPLSEKEENFKKLQVEFVYVEKVPLSLLLRSLLRPCLQRSPLYRVVCTVNQVQTSYARTSF